MEKVYKFEVTFLNGESVVLMGKGKDEYEATRDMLSSPEGLKLKDIQSIIPIN